MQVNFGWLKEPEDHRDVKFRGLPATLKRSSSEGVRIPVTIPIREQVGSSCVGNAWCNALEILAANANVRMTPRSENGLYWQARKHLNMHDRDVGSFIRVGAYCLRNHGVGPKSLHTNDVFEKPSAEYFMNCYDARLTEYQKIEDGNLDAIINAVFSAHPVVFGLQVGADFLQYEGDQSVVFNPPSHSVGGHAMVVVGVRWRLNEPEFLALNSWGEDWGSNGFAWLSSEYMRTAQDCWVGLRHPI
jgi:hypothetical protein